MRIIAWNCNMAFRKKAAYILKERPDIVVVSESERPEKMDFKEKRLIPQDTFWYGDNPHKGLAVYSYSDFKICKMEAHHPDYRYIVPVRLKNADLEFVLLAVWCQKPDNGSNYGSQLWNAIHYYTDLLKNDKIILAGDFNSNSIWDRPKRAANHSNIVQKLRKYKIHSTYHTIRNEIQGEEKQPTFYLYKDKTKPYHLDYCFASIFFMERLKAVRIGSHKKWMPFSDHPPLIIDFKDEL